MLRPRSLAQVAHLRARLEPQLAVLRDQTRWDDSEDPAEALRRLRVATRRLRAFVRLFGPLMGDDQARRSRKQLRAITRGLGPLREWDVVLGGLRAEHALADPLQQAALEHVIAEVAPRRAKAARRANKAVSRVDVAAVTTALDEQLDRICGRLLRVDDQLDVQVWALLEPTMARAFRDLPRPTEVHQVEPLHEVRVRAKRLRYALELLRPTLGEAYRPLRQPAKQIQRAIGEHHDRSVLIDTVRRHRQALAQQGLTTLARALAPLEQRLEGQRVTAHRAATPALDVLQHQRYVTLARDALGIAAPADAIASGDCP